MVTKRQTATFSVTSQFNCSLYNETWDDAMCATVSYSSPDVTVETWWQNTEMKKVTVVEMSAADKYQLRWYILLTDGCRKTTLFPATRSRSATDLWKTVHDNISQSSDGLDSYIKCTAISYELSCHTDRQSSIKRTTYPGYPAISNFISDAASGEKAITNTFLNQIFYWFNTKSWRQILAKL